MSWDVRGKTVVVTGATNGIGYEAVLELARRGAKLVVVGRDAQRTETALAAIKRAGGADATSLLCDFSSQSSIRALAAALLRQCPRIDVLVNNAGTVYKTRQLTIDGIEATFAVNHLGYFLLTTLLLDRIIESAPARVVSVASVGHYRGTMDFDDLGFERGYFIMKAYFRSKLANVLFSNELARRLMGKGVTSNSLHPGNVATNIWSGAPTWAKPLIQVFARPFFLDAKQGAQPIVKLVCDPSLDGVTGVYFDRLQQKAPALIAQDAAIAKELWDVSASFVNR